MRVEHDWDQLAASLSASIDGQVIAPADEAFEGSAALWSARRPRRPALIARVAGAPDVQRVLQAIPQAVPVGIRGRGHDWAGSAHAEGGITIDLSQMRGVQIDVDARIARVEGGARLDDLMDAAGEHGLAAAVGTVNEVGVTGLTLGGGYGPYLGTIGLAADNIISADVVLADGSITRASANENADLLWALRGGGGNFGVVTSLQIGLTELPEVLAGVIAFGTNEIREILTGFDRLLPSVPDELALRPAITSGPDGNPVLLMAVQWSGDAREGAPWVQAAEKLGTPLMSEVHSVAPAQALHALDGMFPAGQHYTVRTVSLPGLTPAAIDALEDGERGRTSPFSAVNIHHLHGAATRTESGVSPWALREPHLMVEMIATTTDADGHEEQVAWADELLSRLEPLGLPAAYPNLLQHSDGERAAATFGDNLSRLHSVKRDVDPTGRFSGIPIGLTSSR